ncbi:hypothetical protein OROMI_000649 [Orobanche minor]
MGVVIESEVWEPNNALYIILFISCLFSIFFLPTKSVTNVVEHAPTASSIRYERNFLILYALASVMQGLWAVFGEYELAYFGLSKEQMLTFLSVGYAVSLFIGSFLGVLSDLIGHKKLCLLFYMLHLFVTICKIVIGTPTIWLISISLSLASSIFSFGFETWMVVEHEKLGQRQDSLNDMFGLMTFFESATLIGSQMVANYLIDGNVDKNIKSTWNGTVVLAVAAIVYVTRSWKEAPQIATISDYHISLHRHAIRVQENMVVIVDTILRTLFCCGVLDSLGPNYSDEALPLNPFNEIGYHDVEILTGSHFTKADGREVLLGLVYPCLLGSKMLGSTLFPWFFHGRFMLRIEEYLSYAFVIMGLALSVVAYDYQEIGVLVSLFCIFHACMGVVLPSLATLRTMYVPNEIRGAIMSLSLMPANASVLFLLVLWRQVLVMSMLQRGYYQCIGNSTIMFCAALGLFSAAGCMFFLKKSGRQLHHSRHHL